MKNFTCQICEREIKASTGVIAHHGYTRPGEGWQTSSCWGARHLPYEKSCDQIPLCMEFIKAFIVERSLFIESMMKYPPQSISRFRFHKEETLQRPADFDAEENLKKMSYGYGEGYQMEHRSRVSDSRRQIKNSEHDLDRLAKRLADWKLIA